MSAICGIYDRDAKCLKGIRSQGDKMISCFKDFPHDSTGVWNNEKIFLGSVLKHITYEDKFEHLPFYNSERKITIVSDSIIDNRKELQTYFHISDDKLAVMPDSEIILLAFLKWKHDCPKYLIGDYAFAIWDEAEDSLFIARDHCGKRTLYYTIDATNFAFATTIKPLLAISDKKTEVNEKWISQNLAIAIPLNQLSTDLTAYKGILQLPPAHSLYVTKNTFQLKKYWNPFHKGKLKFKNNEEYEEAFREVFFEAVRCRLRTIGSVGVLLSSGLDSASVASVAAPMLKKEEKSLMTYTSVPLKDYKEWMGKNILTDESGYIQSIIEKYDNIEPLFSDSEGINSYNTLDKHIEMLEMPFKYSQNFYWIENLTSIAKKDRCTVLLDGQYGNYSISAGDIQSFFCSMISQGKLSKALYEARKYSIVNGRNFESVIKHLAFLYFPQNYYNLVRKLLRKKPVDFSSDILKSILNPSLKEKWGLDDIFKEYGFGKYEKKNATMKDLHIFAAKSLLLSQVAEAEVKSSLAHGLVRRDPTRDKRVIEFCYSLPEEQYVQDGVERSIIRRALNGILPDNIRLNTTVRGAQSADWCQRMQPELKDIKREFKAALENKETSKFLDLEYGYSIHDGVQEELLGKEFDKLQLIMSVISVKRFLEKI